MTCACSPAASDHGAFNGFGSAAEQAAIAALEGFLAFAPTGFDDFDVVFDTASASGVGVGSTTRLMIIHGATLRAIQGATATAGGIFATQTPSTDLAKRIAAQRDLGDPQLVNATLGKVEDVRAAVDNLITVLKSGEATPLVPAPAVSSFKLSRNAKIVIGGVAGVLALAGITALALRARPRAPQYPVYDY